MNWETIARLIIEYGVDTAYKIWKIAQGGEPDEAAWEQLRALSLLTYEDYMTAARQRAADAQAKPPAA